MGWGWLLSSTSLYGFAPCPQLIVPIVGTYPISVFDTPPFIDWVGPRNRYEGDESCYLPGNDEVPNWETSSQWPVGFYLEEIDWIDHSPVEEEMTCAPGRNNNFARIPYVCRSLPTLFCNVIILSATHWKKDFSNNMYPLHLDPLHIDSLNSN